MARQWAKVELAEEGMREGLQIEDANIPVEQKIRLLDALSKTGIKQINVGSFVSPRYTPQMAHIDEIVQGFKPEPGVTYTALALNDRGVQRAREYAPPLTVGRGTFSLGCHQCDVFVRRNANRSQADEIARWPATVAAAKEAGATEAGIGTNASWGSNFLGEFSQEQRMAFLERQHAMWDEAGIKVTSVSLGDPMSWNRPWVVAEQLETIKKRWPDVVNWRLHLHDGRGFALASTYAALTVLEPQDSLHIDTTIGGIGGCPYCGNGRATGMAPTEDVVNMLNEMGIETGIDLDQVVRVVWMLEEILGRPTMGHISKAGPLPRGEKLYDANMPFVETFEQAKHFLLGPSTYEGGIYPWSEPIKSDALDAVKAGKPVPVPV
jgi:hydroxymethylglutaryl-CoA lyase